MRVVIQRVSEASVAIDNKQKASIDSGFMILVGIEDQDAINPEKEMNWLANKIVNLRGFDDTDGVMNKSIIDTQGDILLISQFTLHASTKKGNRPSYIKAAKPEISEKIYTKFCSVLSEKLGKPIHTGVFGADMKVSLTNDGPVTIIIDTLNKE